MVGLPFLVGVAVQHRWDPAAAAKTVAMVEQLMTDVGVKGPIKTREVTEYVQGDQRTGWHMLSVSVDRDLYDVYVGEFGGPIQIVRGYEGYDNRDLKKNDLLPIDSPLIFNYADHILAQLSKRDELGDPSLSFNADNAAYVSANLLRNGRPYTGPAGGYAKYSVAFRPDLGVILGITLTQGAMPVNAKDPGIGLEAARKAAQKALEVKVVDKNGNGWFAFGSAKLTGTWELVNYEGFVDRAARLAWSFEYQINFKVRQRPGGISMSGGPPNDPTIGNIFIDSQSGAFISQVVTSAAGFYRHTPATTKVGKYSFFDATSFPIRFAEDDGLPNPQLELFQKIKAGG